MQPLPYANVLRMAMCPSRLRWCMGLDVSQMRVLRGQSLPPHNHSIIVWHMLAHSLCERQRRRYSHCSRFDFTAKEGDGQTRPSETDDASSADADTLTGGGGGEG